MWYSVLEYLHRHLYRHRPPCIKSTDYTHDIIVRGRGEAGERRDGVVQRPPYSSERILRNTRSPEWRTAAATTNTKDREKLE